MKWLTTTPFDLEKHTVLAGYVGSHSHGTYMPAKDGGIDDKDIMGICVPPKNYYIGLQKFEQVQEWVDEYDIVIYEAKKFMSLLLKNNPNVVGLLWINQNLYVKRTKWGDLLIQNRDLFISKQAYKSFTGYAYSQLTKMENNACNGFMGAKRRQLVEQHGYDTKNAAHLIRLLRTGIELLSTGEVNVFREDAQQLMVIKRGEYSLDKVKEMAEELFKTAQQALVHSSIPDKPDYEKAEQILVEIISGFLKEL